MQNKTQLKKHKTKLQMKKAFSEEKTITHDFAPLSALSNFPFLRIFISAKRVQFAPKQSVCKSTNKKSEV